MMSLIFNFIDFVFDFPSAKAVRQYTKNPCQKQAFDRVNLISVLWVNQKTAEGVNRNRCAGSTRGGFSTKGYPCLYLSWEERGCIQEMNYSPKEDTLASFLYDKDYELQVIDLTIVNNAEYNTDRANIIGHIIWPLLAACYGISEYCKESRKECTNISKNFKIEYVIPQMFAEYVHHQMNIDGIKYYTVRNEHLDPSSSSMKNIVLFTNPRNRTKYDMDLLNKFNIDIIQNNN